MIILRFIPYYLFFPYLNSQGICMGLDRIQRFALAYTFSLFSKTDLMISQTFLHKPAVVSVMLLRPHSTGWIYRDLPGGHHRQWGWRCWKPESGTWQWGWKGAGRWIQRPFEGKINTVFWLVGDPGWRKILSERWLQPFQDECTSCLWGFKNSHLLGFGFCKFRWLTKMVPEKSSRWKMMLWRNYECVKHEMMVRELEISISEPRRKMRTKNACRMIACR